jgi:hypothetical protein
MGHPSLRAPRTISLSEVMGTTHFPLNQAHDVLHQEREDINEERLHLSVWVSLLKRRMTSEKEKAWDLCDPCIRTNVSIWILHARVPGFMESPVMPTICGELQINRDVGTTSFEVLVSPPSPGLIGWAVGHCSRLSKTPLGTGAQVEAFVDSSSVTVLLARGICCRSKTSKSFSSFCAWSG